MLGDSTAPAANLLAPVRDRWDQVLMIGGALGLLLNLLGALMFISLALVSLLSGEAEEALLPAVQGVSLAVVGALGLPAIYWAALGRRRRELGRPWPAWVLALAIFPPAIGLGIVAFDRNIFPGVLGSVAHVLAAGAPVLFVCSLVVQRSPPLTARRRWGHFLAGLWVSPPLAIFVELLALIPVGIALVLGAALSPDTVALLRAIAIGEITNEGQLLEATSELLAQPVVVAVLVGYLSLLVPIIEEMLKTLTIWPLLRRPLTSGQAFLGGALGGAGYALFESLFLPQPGNDWLPTMLARTGTPMIHAFNTGLVALGLALAIRQRKWLQLPLLYGLAVILHGLWNFLALALGLSGYGIDPELGLISLIPVSAPEVAASLGLTALAGLSLAGLIWLPSKLD